MHHTASTSQSRGIFWHGHPAHSCVCVEIVLCYSFSIVQLFFPQKGAFEKLDKFVQLLHRNTDNTNVAHSPVSQCFKLAVLSP